MFIKSKNINNPVLLYVHGGPAFPNYFLIDKYKPGLEDYFTVCYWEQRGGVTRDKFMHQLGIGTMHKMNSVFWDIFVPVWTCKAYTIKEKINIWKSKFSFLPKTNLINEMFTTDFSARVQKLEIPVYFLSGKYDYTVNHDLSKKYFDKLQSPQKEFFTFSKSAHSPIFEEPLLVRQIIEKDILKCMDLANVK